MPVEIVMPRLSDTMTEGTIARWLKQPGDQVKKGDALAEIETDKALMQYESFEEGTLGEIKVGDGQTVPLGEVIAILYRTGEAAPAGGAPAGAPPAERSASGEKGGEAAPAEARAAQSSANGPPVSAPAGAAATSAPPAAGAARGSGQAAVDARAAGGAQPESAPPAPQNGAPGRVRASPLARRLADEHGVDIARVPGTGPGGRVVRADVEQAAAAGPSGGAAGPSAAAAAGPTAAPPLSGELKQFTRMQAVIARRMVESKTQVPHIYLTISIDMAAAMKFRSESNEFLGKESGVSVNDLFVKAIGLTLRKHPDLNAFYRENGIQYNAEVNVGFAVALPGGLVVPVIRNADQKPLPQIAAEARALADKARTSGLALADYEGGTFSTSNLGMLGVEQFDAVVNPPQSGILAIGAITEEPVVKDGQVVVGRMCRVTLSCDHRVVYGWTAGEFLRDLKALMERPFGLVY